MPPNDWEYTYNGLTFGGNTAYGVNMVEGLDPGEVRLNTVDKPADHGAWTYARFLGHRQIIFHGDMDGSGSSIQAVLDAWRAAFRPQISDLPLVMKQPNWSARRIYCKPTRRYVPVDLDYQLGLGSYVLQLTAEDPLFYADTEDSLQVLAGANGTANNAGDMSSKRATITLLGPGTTFTITNTTQTKFLKLNATLAAAESWTIDFMARTITKSDGTNKYSFLDSTSQWWDIQPGDNTISLAVVSGSTGATKITLNWRDAWD